MIGPIRCRTAVLWGVLGAWMSAAMWPLHAAPPGGPQGVNVELPALIQAGHHDWLYASCEGVEVLAASSEAATRTYVENIVEQRSNLDALLPRDMRLSWERPITVVLYSSDNPRPLPMEFLPILSRVYTERERERAAENREGKPLQVLVMPNVMPGAWVPDLDGICFFNGISPRLRASELSALPAAQYIAFLLEARNPPLPRWLIDAISTIFAQASMTGSELEVMPAIWISPAQSALMVRDKSITAQFLPLGEIFAHVNPGTAPTDEGRRTVLRSEAALLLRWALEGRAPGGTDAFWKFARGLRPGVDNEAWFKTCFGITTDEAIAALRSYLPQALRKRAYIRVPREKRSTPIQIRPATPAEVARLRGEWERLASVLIRGIEPSLSRHYEQQARQTVASGPADDDADPALLAARGLMAVEARDDEAALPLLEAACRAPDPRPGAVVELARIRLARARAGLAEGARIDAATAASIIASLRNVLGSRPPMPRAYQVLADTLGASEQPPSAGDIEELIQGVNTMPSNVGLVLSVARLLIDQEHFEQARAVIDTGLAYVSDDAGRRRLFAMRSGLRSPARK